MPTVNDNVDTAQNTFGLKYFRISFRYRDAVKSLRLMGWSEQAVLEEFSAHFPEAAPEHIECLGRV